MIAPRADWHEDLHAADCDVLESFGYCVPSDPADLAIKPLTVMSDGPVHAVIEFAAHDDAYLVSVVVEDTDGVAQVFAQRIGSIFEACCFAENALELLAAGKLPTEFDDEDERLCAAICLPKPRTLCTPVYSTLR